MAQKQRKKYQIFAENEANTNEMSTTWHLISEWLPLLSWRLFVHNYIGDHGNRVDAAVLVPAVLLMNSIVVLVSCVLWSPPLPLILWHLRRFACVGITISDFIREMLPSNDDWRKLCTRLVLFLSDPGFDKWFASSIT